MSDKPRDLPDTDPASGGYWSGDEWRWRLTARTSQLSISIIEPADEEKPKDPRAVPFGFARVLAPEPAEVEPLLWEGAD